MNKTIASVLITAPALLCLALPAAAEGRDGGWHGDRGHFQRVDMDHWRRDGRWRHGWHDGRIGWWWVVGGLWYIYPAPVYPYPDFYAPPVVVEQQPPIVVQQPAPTVVIQQTQPPAPPAQVLQPAPAPAPTMAPPPAQNNWYYCEPSKAYYPYVNSCPTGWKVVPASPPPVPQ